MVCSSCFSLFKRSFRIWLYFEATWDIDWKYQYLQIDNMVKWWYNFSLIWKTQQGNSVWLAYTIIQSDKGRYQSNQGAHTEKVAIFILRAYRIQIETEVVKSNISIHRIVNTPLPKELTNISNKLGGLVESLCGLIGLEEFEDRDLSSILR